MKNYSQSSLRLRRPLIKSTSRSPPKTHFLLMRRVPSQPDLPRPKILQLISKIKSQPRIKQPPSISLPNLISKTSPRRHNFKFRALPSHHPLNDHQALSSHQPPTSILTISPLEPTHVHESLPPGIPLGKQTVNKLIDFMKFKEVAVDERGVKKRLGVELVDRLVERRVEAGRLPVKSLNCSPNRRSCLSSVLSSSRIPPKNNCYLGFQNIERFRDELESAKH